MNAHNSASGAPGGEAARRVAASPGQERLWFLNRLHPHLRHNILVELLLDGPLDYLALSRAIQCLVRTHDALRTTFSLDTSGLVQCVHRLQATGVETIDGTHVSTTDTVRAERAHRFDLETGPLVRFVLIKSSPTQHALIINAHHIVVDRTSLQIMLDDLATFYSGRTVIFGATKVHDSSPSVRTSHEKRIHARLATRCTELTDAPLVTTFPSDHRRPSVQTFASARHTFEVPTSATVAVQDAAHELRTTPFTVVLANLAILLTRYSGHTDLVIATLVDGRAAVGVERAVGFFANTVPIRIQTDGVDTFAEMISRTRAATLAALDASEVPFHTLVSELAVPRDLSRMPLAQVACVIHHQTLHCDLEGLNVRVFELPPGSAEFDLSVAVQLDKSRMDGHITYDRALYSRASIQRLANEFVLMLGALSSAPRAKIADLTDGGGTSNGDTYRFAPSGESIVQRIDGMASRSGCRTALVVDDQSLTLTYAELASRVAACAQSLRDSGCQRGTVVAICVERSLDLVIGMLAAMHVGAIYLPLDPTHPPKRLSYLLSDSNASHLITQPWVAERIPFNCASVTLLDGTGIVVLGAVHDEQPINLQNSSTRLDDGAYLIYTSGSTGTPKGVLVTQRNLSAFCDAIDEIFDDEDGVWLAATTVSFDIAVLELLWPLTRGFRIVLQTSELERVASDRKLSLIAGDRTDASPLEQTLRLIEKHGVTHFQCTPTLLELILNLPKARAVLRRLRHLLIGGEQFSHRLVGLLRDFRSTQVWNMYGPTEATIWATAQRVNLDTPEVPIGRPLRHARAYVLDENGTSVAPGVIGEIALGGPCVAAGYWNAPGPTAARFVPDKVAGAGSRLFLTGDMGSLRPDGTLLFHGRGDHQVKVRGVRIELQELERALEDIPLVERAIASAAGEGADRQLVAYVMLSRQRDSGAEEANAWRQTLSAALRETLPAYMIPSRLVRLDAFPTTANGKIDRSRLPPPHIECSPDYRQPVDEVERRIASAWQEALGRRIIDREVPFFDAGGDSLRLIRLQLSLREHLSMDLDLIDLFKYQTVAELAEHIRATRLDA
jgi:amino acid adenylation domain-containing protein